MHQPSLNSMNLPTKGEHTTTLLNQDNTLLVASGLSSSQAYPKAEATVFWIKSFFLVNLGNYKMALWWRIESKTQMFNSLGQSVNIYKAFRLTWHAWNELAMHLSQPEKHNFTIIRILTNHIKTIVSKYKFDWCFIHFTLTSLLLVKLYKKISF